MHKEKPAESSVEYVRCCSFLNHLAWKARGVEKRWPLPRKWKMPFKKAAFLTLHCACKSSIIPAKLRCSSFVSSAWKKYDFFSFRSVWSWPSVFRILLFAKSLQAQVKLLAPVVIRRQNALPDFAICFQMKSWKAHIKWFWWDSLDKEAIPDLLAKLGPTWSNASSKSLPRHVRFAAKWIF